jgi:hypothetical protein
MANFDEISVLLQNESGSIKTLQHRGQLNSKKVKTHFYGNCLQLGRDNNKALDRWILCNEQEDNTVRLEDFSKGTPFTNNVLIFTLDNPLLFKPQIKEYKEEILVSFMSTSYATYFFSFPNPRFQTEYEKQSIFAGVNAPNLTASSYQTNFSNKHPSAFEVVKPHVIVVGFEEGTVDLVTLSKTHNNNIHQELNENVWFPKYSKIVSIKTICEEDDYVYSLDETGKIRVWATSNCACIFSKIFTLNNKGSYAKAHSLRIFHSDLSTLHYASILFGSDDTEIECQIHTFNRVGPSITWEKEARAYLTGTIIDCDLTEDSLCVLTLDNTKAFANFMFIENFNYNSWNTVEIKPQSFRPPNFELIGPDIDAYCLTMLFESGVFPRSVVYLALSRLFRYKNPEFLNMSTIEQRDEVIEQIKKQEFDGNVFSPSTKIMWKQYFDLCCLLNEQEPIAVNIVPSGKIDKKSDDVMVIKKHGISFIVPGKYKKDDSLMQCLNFLQQRISPDVEFTFDNHLMKAELDFPQEILSQIAQTLLNQNPKELSDFIESNKSNSIAKIDELLKNLDFVLPTYDTTLTSYFALCEFASIKNVIAIRFKLAQSILLFAYILNTYSKIANTAQMKIINDWLKLLFSYKWLFQNANAISTSGITLPSTIVKFLSVGNQMNINEITLTNMRNGATSLERQLLIEGHHYLLGEFIRLSTKTANSYHNLGESMLMCGDFIKAKENFTKASELLSDHSLDDFLNEDDQSDKSALIKYRVMIVGLWNKNRRHDYVIDEAYLGLSCVEDEASKTLFFGQIFKNALLSEKYNDAYLVIISREPGIDRDLNLKRLIEVLCEKGQLETLVQLPYFETLGQVIEILFELARRSSACDRPTYYEILYAFLIQRGDYITAASSIYECATRLQNEHISREMTSSKSPLHTTNKGLLEVLSFRMDCLNLSINALSLSHRQNFIYRPPIRSHLTFAQLKKKTKDTTSKERKINATQSLVLGIDVLKKEELIAHSLFTLISVNSIQLAIMDSFEADRILDMLIENKHFDLAFTVACEFNFSKSPIYVAITKTLIKDEKQIGQKITWEYLKFLLQKFENEVPKFQHYGEVIEKMLGSSLTPPQWIIDGYNKSFYPSLQVTRGLKNQLTNDKDTMMVEGI